MASINKELLWQKILGLPQKYGFKHDFVAVMRKELKTLLVRELVGEYSDILFGSENIESRVHLNANEWLHVEGGESKSHHGRPCARRLVKGEPTHRCLTCGLDDTCVLCKDCFNPDEHIGHNVFVRISSRDDGGICDCGDAEAWLRPLHCFSDTGAHTNRPVPVEFERRARDVTNVMLDFLVDVCTGATLARSAFPSEEQILAWTETSRIYPEIRGIDNLETPPEKWCLLIYDDDRKSVTDLSSFVRKITGRSNEFVKMIGKKLSKDGRAMISISDDLNELLKFKQSVLPFSLAIKPLIGVLYEEMADEVIHLLNDFSRCRLNNYEPSALTNIVGQSLLDSWVPGVKSRGFIDTEKVALIYKDSAELLTDIQGYDIPSERLACLWDKWFDRRDNEDDKSSPESRDLEIFGPQCMIGKTSSNLIKCMDAAIAANDLKNSEAQSLSEIADSDSDDTISVPILTLEDDCDSARNHVGRWPLRYIRPHVLYLMFCDVRLYKSFRKVLVDLYVNTLVRNTALKIDFGEIYGDVYPRLVGHHANVDKYPYMSITTQLSSQLFTTPSIATMLMENHGFEVYISMLYSLFTKSHQLEPTAFTNRRLNQTFLELLSLMMRNTRKELVGGNSTRLIRSARFLSLFQGIAPIQRENGEHVLYESERWIFWYSTLPYVLQFTRGIAVGIQDTEKLPIRGTNVISGLLSLWQQDIDSFLQKLQTFTNFSFGPFSEVTCDRSGRDVFNDPVSLIHPVHAFLGWLIEYADLKSVDQLKNLIGKTALKDDHVTQKQLLALFDAPMCTLAVLSQISSGLWVRNGYTIRYQLQCYRDTILRELAFAQDVFMTQVGLSLIEPNTAFTNLVHHFGISSWPEFPNCDEQQAFHVLDEFLHCVTYLICSRIRLENTNSVETKNAAIAMEIIQVLWFNSMSYSELVKQVCECFSSDEMFDLILNDCADFQPPTGTHGSGIYSLKKELFERFDPQYVHFSLSKIEEAERLLETRNPQQVHIPPLLPLIGPFQGMTVFTRSAAFGRVCYNLLKSLIDNSYAQCDQSLGRLLYLFIVVAKDDIVNGGIKKQNCFDTFVELVKSPTGDGGECDSIMSLLYEILKNDKFLSLNPKVNKLLELLHEKDPSVELPKFTNASASEAILQEESKRKAKGKAMQQKVLDDFMRQQKQFMQANSEHAAMDLDSSDQGMEDDNDNGAAHFTFPKHCVLCCMPDEEDSIFGMLTYTSQINLLRYLPSSDPYWVNEAYSEDPSLDVEHPLPKSSDGTGHIWGPAFPSSEVRNSTIVQGCGHGVHHHCFTELLNNQQQQRMSTRFTTESLAKNEFLCPLCHGLNNSFMPVMATTNSIDANDFLEEPPLPLENIDHALDSFDEAPNVSAVIKDSLSSVNTKFLEAIMYRTNYRTSFPANVRAVLLDHMLRIRENTCMYTDAIFGLNTVYNCFSATISQIEVSLRGIKHNSMFGGLLVDQLNARTVEFLRVFAEYIKTLTGFVLSNLPMDADLNSIKLYPISGDDTLSNLVFMYIFGSSANGVKPKTALRLAYVTEILRILITIRDHPLPDFPEASTANEGNTLDPNIANEIGRWTTRDPKQVYRVLQFHMTVMLRRYALLTFSICGTYDPDDFAGMMVKSEEQRLSEYLGLPDLQTTLSNLSMSSLEGHAARRLAVCFYNERINLVDQIEYPGVYRLIPLMYNLESMFNVPGQNLPTNPAICLVCADVCSLQESDNEFEIGGVGQCNAHVEECGCSQGIFLIPRRNVILLLISEGRGSFVKTPYLDLHGEADEGMRRGRPHFLQPLRYAAFIREVWLQNGLPSLIARKLDQTQDTGGWETL
ncbi:putative ubiquitin-protein ligase [Starmerella bacillaris]|uniref:E3 ubiquitin-protein ligase n=1 Tax=Starmerella bacillaris TaxID=1247836 RepID=A0AAV5RIH7_STABA|nr:putative ubiquitin-protein ligase [Starmerella bacillaris]